MNILINSDNAEKNLSLSFILTCTSENKDNKLNIETIAKSVLKRLYGSCFNLNNLDKFIDNNFEMPLLLEKVSIKNSPDANSKKEMSKYLIRCKGKNILCRQMFYKCLPNYRIDKNSIDYEYFKDLSLIGLDIYINGDCKQISFYIAGGEFSMNSYPHSYYIEENLIDSTCLVCLLNDGHKDYWFVSDMRKFFEHEQKNIISIYSLHKIESFWHISHYAHNLKLNGMIVGDHLVLYQSSKNVKEITDVLKTSENYKNVDILIVFSKCSDCLTFQAPNHFKCLNYLEITMLDKNKMIDASVTSEVGNNDSIRLYYDKLNKNPLTFKSTFKRNSSSCTNFLIPYDRTDAKDSIKEKLEYLIQFLNDPSLNSDGTKSGRILREYIDTYIKKPIEGTRDPLKEWFSDCKETAAKDKSNLIKSYLEVKENLLKEKDDLTSIMSNIDLSNLSPIPSIEFVEKKANLSKSTNFYLDDESLSYKDYCFRFDKVMVSARINVHKSRRLKSRFLSNFYDKVDNKITIDRKLF